MGTLSWLRAARAPVLFLCVCGLAAGPLQSPVVDPVLSFLSLLGFQGASPIQAVALDAAGNIYITGSTLSEIPLVNPIQPTRSSGNCSPYPFKTTAPCEEVFVAKLDPTGAKLFYSTYLGTDGRNIATGIAVDQQGNAYVTGNTRPASFFSSSQDGNAFVFKLNASGSALVYSRYIGGDTAANGIVVDAQGNAYVAGVSLGEDFPAVHALQPQALQRTILATHDGGQTWRALGGPPALVVYSLAIDPTRTSTLYAAPSGGLYKSADGGAGWNRLLPTAATARQVTLDPQTPSTLYVTYGLSAGNFTQLAKSVDAGANWQNLPIPPQKIGGAASAARRPTGSNPREYEWSGSGRDTPTPRCRPGRS